MSPGDPKALANLTDKYRELIRLRRAPEHPGAREAMAALARRFPGALRQLDRLPMRLLEARLVALDGAVGGRASAPPWAWWEVAYHGRLRAVLRVKRALRGAPSDEAAMAAGSGAWRADPPEPGEPAEDFSRGHLGAIRRPPGGRLAAQVLVDVAREVGATVDELRRVLFPPLSETGDDDGA